VGIRVASVYGERPLRVPSSKVYFDEVVQNDDGGPLLASIVHVR